MGLRLMLLATVLTRSAGAAESGPDESPRETMPLLVMPIVGPESPAVAFEAELGLALRALLGERSVVTAAEVNVGLRAERTKDLLGCTDVSCLNDVVGALGGTWVLAVTLVEAQPLCEVTAIVRDVRDPLRAFRVERRTPSLMPARLHDLASDLAQGIAAAAGWSAVAAPRSVPSGGRLEIRTRPSGARLFLNAMDIGRSPAALSGLAAGRYNVRTTDVGFDTASVPVDLSAGQARALEIPLSLLHNWQAGLDLLFAMRGLGIAGQSQRGELLTVGVGATYSRRVLGPLELGGALDYSHLEYGAATQTAGNYVTFAKSDGVAVGVSASVPLYLGLSSLAEGVAASGLAPVSAAQADQALASLESESADFALVSLRPRVRLTYTTPSFLSAEGGLELGMLSIFHVEAGYSLLLAHPATPFARAGHTVNDLAVGGFYVHLVVGYSSFYRAPVLQ